MTVIAQLDNSKSPAVVTTVYDYGSDTPPASLAPPDYVDVTDVNPRPAAGYTYDGQNFAPGVPQQQQANQQTIQGRAQAALAANATFLALAPPTNAQVLAQVQ